MTINGLVLAGGQSTRMGIDKAAIQYHGQSQASHTASLLRQVGCHSVYISMSEQRTTPSEQPDFPILVDNFPHTGPLGAVLTAFMHQAATAWFVVACDYPLLDEADLAELILCRDPHFHATAFENPQTGDPEPLITIYEPVIYPTLLQAQQEQKRSLLKILRTSPVKRVSSSNPDRFLNANTQNDYQKVRSILRFLGEN